MIQVLKRLFRRRSAVIPPTEHRLQPQRDISKEALGIIGKLQDNGYTAYIVGGAVRDLLLGFHPKDFDIATDATAEEIVAIFRRRARRIGKRFPIIHLYNTRNRKTLYHDYIEVTTFQGTKENRPGTPYEDAHRRDFTINGIFYDPIDGNIYDYVGGTADIKEKKLRMLGNSKKRLPEDPMRILRALRFSTKLGLSISDKLEKSFAAYVPLLVNIPTARIFDEMIKVINSGAGTRIFQQWQQFNICPHIIPVLQEPNPLFFSVMAENDRRVAEKRNNSLTFIIAALFWEQTAALWHQQRGSGMPSVLAMESAIGQVPFRQNAIIPQRLAARTKDLYFLQAQMENTPTVRRATHIINKPFFDRALAFASRRQDNGAAQTASWWAQFVQSNDEERARLLANAPKERKRRRRKRTAE